MTRGQVWGAALAALMAAGAWSCGQSAAGRPTEGGSAGPRPAAATAAPPEVTVTMPVVATLDASIEVPGTFIPWEEAAIAALAAGTVTEVRIDEGSRVVRGELVVRLDATKAQLAVRQAEAVLAQARAGFEKAKSDLARKQTLLADRTIAPGTFDAFKAQYDAAAAGVEAAETALQLARRRLDDMTVTVPFDGIVRDKRVSVGQYVREGDTLFVLMRVDPLKLQFDLPEKYAGRVLAGQQVHATVTALPGQAFSGAVQTVFPSVAVQSRTLRINARVPNSGYRLKPGFFASVRVPLAPQPGGLAIPRAALVRREGTDHVFVVRGDQVVLVRIETGVETASQVEVLSGLSATDRIVASGLETLRDGDRVQVKG